MSQKVLSATSSYDAYIRAAGEGEEKVRHLNQIGLKCKIEPCDVHVQSSSQREHNDIRRITMHYYHYYEA